jgi:hypothetical protein
MPNVYYICRFISALDSTFPVWADRQRSTARTKLPDLNTLYTDIADEARRTNGATDDTNISLYSNNPRQKASSEKLEKPTCSHCEKVGHIEDRCFKKDPSKKPKWMVMRDEENEKNYKGSSKLATEGFTLVATTMVANSFKTKWLVDTRAFHYMTYD